MTELISVPLSLDPCHSQCVAGLSTCQFTSSGYACQCVDGYHRESSTTDYACVGNCFCFLVLVSDLLSCRCERVCRGAMFNCSYLYKHCGKLPVCVQSWLYRRWSQLLQSVVYLYATMCMDDLLHFPDVNECLGMPSPCSAHATCNDSDGSFSCTCQSGYVGDGLSSGTACSSNYFLVPLPCRWSCDLFCLDVNECALSPCDVNADCADTAGSFQCTCNSDFIGDGLNCYNSMLLHVPVHVL